MNAITLPGALRFKNDADRTLFSKVTLYSFILFCVLPLVAGVLLPYWFSLTDDPFAALPLRLVLLAATGGASFLIVFLPAFLLLRSRLLRKAYVFSLLPLSLFSLAGQSIMYREFGTEIDTRAIGLVQGNFSALWNFACEEYHVQWVIAGVLLTSLALTFWICRSTRKNWTLSFKPCLIVGFLLSASGAVAVALSPDLENVDHYHPTKLSNAPLFQIVSFLGKHYIGNEGSGYRGILERVGKIDGSERKEITRRLGTTPEKFSQRTAAPPDWLKQRPTHIFLFLMESFGQGLIDEPDLAGLAPCLTRYATEGLSVPNFTESGPRTIDAVQCMASGVASLSRYPVPRTLTNFPLDTLPQLLRRAGYKSVFLAASYRKYGSKGDVCEAYGYDAFIDCPAVAAGLKKNDWGVNDGDFYQWARQELTDLSSPHFVTFLNVSNHSPYDAPLHELGEALTFSDTALSRFAGRTREEKIRFAKHMTYADRKIGDMVAHLRDRHPDALFIFTGDHNSAKMHSDPTFRVPFILWNDRVVDSSVDTSRWFGTHSDVLATIANLVLPAGEPFRTLGEPVWHLNRDRVSPAGSLLLSPRGCMTRKGQMKVRFPEPPASEDVPGPPVSNSQSVLKGSAIEALSWGYLNAKYLP